MVIFLINHTESKSSHSHSKDSRCAFPSECPHNTFCASLAALSSVGAMSALCHPSHHYCHPDRHLYRIVIDVYIFLFLSPFIIINFMLIITIVTEAFVFNVQYQKQKGQKHGENEEMLQRNMASVLLGIEWKNQGEYTSWEKVRRHRKTCSHRKYAASFMTKCSLQKKCRL